ncbi:amidohydrolase family protein [Aquimarina sp. 2201CG14-23]|uniref:amidohydrolase family protein n=1 Tax=Aquimarina mycalae TaxID=3040073 RepID=UPI002477E444|nr:amidohydrolase family protein [Aquimarina sp. 2201CG14-23]MDH7447160.1 amidohydrolase family protein [Aquimarina sp. 2201CG14-23]
MMQSIMKSDIIIIFTLLCLSILGCSKKEKKQYDIVISNVNLIEIENGNISKKTMYINDGKIVKLENNDSTNNYITKNKIDGTEKFLLPGFWDNHIHLRGGDALIDENKNLLPLFIANGITTIRDAGGDLTTEVIKWKKEIEGNKLIGPTIYTSGPKLDGANATWAGSLVIESSEDVTKALDSLARIPSDFVKIYDSRISRENYLEILKQATNRGVISSGHMPFTVELNEAIDAGIGAIEHLYYILKGCSSEEASITQAIISKELSFWDAMDSLITTYNDSTAQKTFSQLKDNNTYVVPTLHIGNILSYLDEVDHSNDPYLKIIGKGIIKTYDGRIKRALSASDEAKKSRKELNAFFKKLTKYLQEADVKLLAGSDSGAYNSYTYSGISLHKELEAMVSVGLTPLEAIQTSAYHGSKYLKKNKTSGTIEIGKDSDLVILHENPLLNIKNTQNIFRVVKGQKIYDPLEITKQYNCQECFSFEN